MCLYYIYTHNMHNYRRTTFCTYTKHLHIYNIFNKIGKICVYKFNTQNLDGREKEKL